MPTTTTTQPETPSEGLAAVVALRRLADRLEVAEVERALRPASRPGGDAMFERFVKDSKLVVLGAMEEARARSEAKIEAEHLLLALARRSSGDAAHVLSQAGLDHDRLRAALDEETWRTLELVGVGSGAEAPWIPDTTLPGARQPRWGESAKAALSRAVTVAKTRGDRHLAPTHILLGVLRAHEGTVPRALAAAGVDVADLEARAEASLHGR
jgi:D-alanyl-D-alanine carboxypeptidase